MLAGIKALLIAEPSPAEISGTTQCRPFELGEEKTGLILFQNKGTQAAIIRKIITAQEEFGGSLWKPSTE